MNDLKLARAFYHALRGKTGALVQGAPPDETIIDGAFNLTHAASLVLNSLVRDGYEIVRVDDIEECRKCLEPYGYEVNPIYSPDP